MKNSTQLLLKLFFWCLVALSPLLLPAQGVQWTSSVNVGGGGSAPWADWIFDVITTQQGNYLAVGFAKEDEVNHQHPDVPAYCLIGPNGGLLRDGVVEIFDPGASQPMQGRLSNVIEGSNDSYYSVGFIGGFGPNSKGLLIRINKTSLDHTPFIITPQGFTTARLSDIVQVNAPTPYLLVSGQATNGGPSQRWIAAYNFDGTLIHEQVFPLQGDWSEQQNTLDYEIEGNHVNIYYAAYKQTSSDGGGHRRHDSDILIGKITYTPTTGVFSEMTESYNSIEQGPRDELAMQSPVGAGTIFDEYPPVKADKYPYGPKYVGTPFERNFENCNESASANGYYIEDWSDGSEDVPYSMVSTNDEIVVSTLLNRLIMWEGTNNNLGNDTDPGLHCGANACSEFKSNNYLWGEAYLLFFRKSNLSLKKATHLATMSGGDFIPKVIKTSDGGFAVSGTVAGCPDGLPPVGGSEHMMVIKLDNNGNVLWRKHYNGQGEGGCGFAITESPDGGLVVAGNTEGDAPNHEENFGFIKFGSDCDYDGANILPNNGGKDYVVAANEPAWNTSRLVKARVVIPSGRTLTISGSTTVIRFADSKEVYDAAERYPIGIMVEPGGKLVVSGATLTGYDCGTEKMWDGINVVGNPGLPQTALNQGVCSLLVAKILNARQGIVTSGVWCGVTTSLSPPYGGTGSQSSVQTSALYHGGPFGGGLVVGLFSKFIDNQRSAIFMQYPHNQNQSRFTGCEFISNGPLVDPNEMRQPIPNDYNNNEPRGTSIHVSIWSTRVQFSSCKFNGALSIIPEYRPFGIEGDDPKIVASGGNMKDLKVGIECRGPLGGLLANVNANGITFDNVVQGINLRASVADIVNGCKFLNIPVPNTYSGLSPAGIFGQYNRGALIRFNEFYGVEPGKPSWGIVENNTQNQGCEIKENKFFTTLVGNQFEGSNTQLTASCNDYTGLGLSAWYAAVTFGSGQLKDQGTAALGLKADNEFFDLCDGSSNLHIEADANFTPFNYFDKIGNLHAVDADCANDIVNVNISNDPSAINCYVPEPPCPNPPCDRRAIYLTSRKTVQDRNAALRGLIHVGLDANNLDLPADYEGAMFVLRDRNQPEDRSILVGSLASMDRYRDAQYENAQLTARDPESVAYKAFMDNILAAGTSINALPASNYRVAMASLQAENVSTRALAENLQYLNEGVYTPLIAVSPQISTDRSYRPETTSIRMATFVAAQPNPFSNEVSFDLKGLDASMQYQVLITDLYGRLVLNTQAIGGQPFVWNAAEFADGQYFYQIRTDKATIHSGKLMKISR